MSLRVLVKDEPECDVTDDVCMKAEPELNESEWVDTDPECGPQQLFAVESVCGALEAGCWPQELCVDEAMCSTQEAKWVPQDLCVFESVWGAEEVNCDKEKPICVIQETVCVKDEPVGVQQTTVCVKQEPSSQDAPGPEFKYEIQLDPCKPPSETDVKHASLVRDCWVQLERCDEPRAAAPPARHGRPLLSRSDHPLPASGHPPATHGGYRRVYSPSHFTTEHERELALQQLSRLLITRLNKRKCPFSCAICKTGFTRLDDLTAHKQLHIQNSKKRDILGNVLTIVLDKKSPSAPARRPPRASGPSARPLISKGKYFCETCSSSFSDINRLQVHKLVDHAKPKVTYTCGICNIKCPSNYILKMHKRFHMVAGRPHLCNDCKKRFPRASDLAKHRSAIHSEKVHLCKTCEARQAEKLLNNLCGRKTSGEVEVCETCRKVLT